jgi:hypothetical protein
LDASVSFAFRRHVPETSGALASSKAAIFTLMETSDMRYLTPDDASELLRYRVRGEYLEMPGLRLTLDQAARLWHMDAAICAAVLTRLVADRFLTRTGSGAYVRLDEV